MQVRAVYLSGPLFSPEERAAMNAIAHALEAAGWSTYLPQRDGLERIFLRFSGTPLARLSGVARGHVDRAIFALDLFHLVTRCSHVVVNLNGRVPDEGAVAEAAIAFAVGHPVVLYKEDARSVFDGGDNSMVVGLSPIAPVARVDQLVRALERAGARITAPAGPPPDGPLARAVARGQAVQRWLERIPSWAAGGPDEEQLATELRAIVEA